MPLQILVSQKATWHRRRWETMVVSFGRMSIARQPPKLARMLTSAATKTVPKR